MNKTELGNIYQPDEVSLSATIATVAAPIIGLPPASGGDDTAAMNAVLASAPAGSIVRGQPGSSYVLTAALIIKSNQTLDMTGCTITAASTAHSMLKNEHAVTAGPFTPTDGTGPNRDSNIRVVGGAWVGGATDGNRHRLHFHQVDGITVENLSVTSASGKYAILFADVTNYIASRIVFASASDGVHITGPATHGRVSDITGTTGDDTVGVTCADYSTYDYSRGSVTDLTVERIATSTPARSVLLGANALPNDVGTGTLRINKVSLTDIFANATQGIRIDVGNTGPTRIIENIVIRNVLNNAISGNGAINFLGTPAAGSYIGVTKIDGLQVSDQNNAPTGGRQYGVNVGITGIRGIIVAGELRDISGRDTRGVFVPSTGGIDFITFTGSSDFVNTTSDIVHSEGAVGAVNVTGTFKGGGVVWTAAAGSIARATVAATQSGGGMVVHTSTTATPLSITLAGCAHASSTTPLVRVTGSAAVVNISGDGASTYSIGLTNRSAAQQVNIVSPGLRAQLDQVTPTAGNIAYNTKASLACGTGLCAADGTTWKNLLTGATYTP